MPQQDLNKVMARMEQFIADFQKRIKGDISTIRDLKVLLKDLDAEEFNESDRDLVCKLERNFERIDNIRGALRMAERSALNFECMTEKGKEE
ncbi:MAG TPA: hypothetical protein PL033_01065 [Candidatus Brocadiia bacterium]|nr:hypothetical protein [Candidatus Brocadiia bacterium]